jgi:HSP20 family molecular chaperone IbpA
MKTIKKTKKAAAVKKTVPAKKANTTKAAVVKKTIPSAKTTPATESKKNEVAIISSPSWNIRDEGNYYKVRVSIPGLSKKDIKINIIGKQLILSSEKEDKKEKTSKNYIVKQYSYNSWSKSITLPEEVSAKDIKMDYKDGIFKLNLNKVSSK